MELKITTKTPEPLLSRTQIIGEIMFETVTPSKKEVITHLAKMVHTPETAIALRVITTRYGTHQAHVVAYAYQDEQAKKNTEIRTKPKKDAASKNKEASQEK